MQTLSLAARVQAAFVEQGRSQPLGAQELALQRLLHLPRTGSPSGDRAEAEDVPVAVINEM